ncbi:MAG: alpha-glucosidase [Bifidobacteriaceae bacterium]|jgi:oligo-1,6-glucosidase|nr:alpha-glucosidase [Bifidobacteriaceae bacterium]MCI1914840.1 alpha-glucosidase [Bifidobacteriaceae bacterium]
MTSDQRVSVPDSIRTNGASPNPWWANAVVYQIYPRSFQDSNGDGIGDLPGITSRLDYLADLGIDVIWLCPVYRSPQDDNGYDISDYRDIDPLFGTLDDMDELLAEAHERGIKVIMDLVVNHTSDEHAWFQESRDKFSDRADWYWWRPAREGHVPGTPGAEPNAWGSYFGGSAWQFDEVRGEYYLHLFSKKQPDLNWENPDLRAAVYSMMNWWMDRGVDGFRMDVISLISKTLDPKGRLPGESGGSIQDGPIGPEGYSDSEPFCSGGPRFDEFLKEMRAAVFSGREGFLTVGEAPGIEADQNRHITNPTNGELDMLFLFDQCNVGHGPKSKWDLVDWDARDLKRALGGHQDAVREVGWTSLFLDNHDQPRAVSRFGDDSTEKLRSLSAKALALLIQMHRGTPYIYQGEELGMTNAGFTELSQYRDLESINLYHQRVDEAHISTPAEMLNSLAHVSRDNARTPMQWDASTYAGFTAPYAPREPWISVNPNKDVINAKAQQRDPDSVFNFVKKLIDLRHTNITLTAGLWDLLDPEDPFVYSFRRSLDEDNDLDTPDDEILVAVNISSHSSRLPEQTAALINGQGDSDSVLLSNYDASSTAASLMLGKLSPWEAFIYRLK